MDSMQEAEEFLALMAKTDELLCGDPEIDGASCYMQTMAQTARDMIEEHAIDKFTVPEQVIDEWSDRSTKLWQSSKFFQLYDEISKAGGNIEQAFAERGWEP